jgi:undecaprenol kinase
MQFIKSVRYALRGIKYCFNSERNFRIELIIALATCLLAIILGIQANEWLVILLCSALVLSLEIINTAIEKLSNVVSTSIHPVIRLVKDMAAGAVFLVSIASIIAAGIIFIPRMLKIF